MEILVKALRFLAQWGASTGLAGSEHYVDRPYPAAWSYSGAYQFKKHFFGSVGELASTGEEFECAKLLDTLPAVTFWIRNLSTRPQTSFWLPAQREASLQRIRKVGRREWQKESGYRQQARVENSFFRYKSVFGGDLKARHSKAQRREAAIGCHILNRMAELGRPSSYALGR